MKRNLLIFIGLMVAIGLTAQVKTSNPFSRTAKKNSQKITKTQILNNEGRVRLDSTLMYTAYNGSEEIASASKYYYDNQGRIIEELDQYRMSENPELSDIWKVLYNYDGDKFTSIVEYMVQYGSDSWVPSDSSVYSYNGDLIDVVSHYWFNESNSSWEMDTRDLYYYGDDDLVDSIVTETTYDDENDPVYKEVYVYENGNLVEWTALYWAYPGWEYGDRTEYVYENGELVTEIESIYDESEWLYQYKYEYTWEDNGNLLGEDDYYWEESSETWEQEMHLDPFYDNNYGFEDLILPYSMVSEGEANKFFAHKIDSAYITGYGGDWDSDMKVRFHYSEFVGLDNQLASQENFFTIYPNPASDQIKISSHIANNGTIEIFDNIGRSVKKTEYYGGITLDVRELTQGIYFVTFSSGGDKETQKLIIE